MHNVLMGAGKKHVATISLPNLLHVEDHVLLL